MKHAPHAKNSHAILKWFLCQKCHQVRKIIHAGEIHWSVPFLREFIIHQFSIIGNTNGMVSFFLLIISVFLDTGWGSQFTICDLSFVNCHIVHLPADATFLVHRISLLSTECCEHSTTYEMVVGKWRNDEWSIRELITYWNKLWS